MVSLSRFVPLALPMVFFGYATFANIDVFANFAKVVPQEEVNVDTVLKGKIAGEFSNLYKEQLPHIEPSIGLFGAARYVLLNAGREGVRVGKDGWLFTSEEFVQPGNAQSAVDPAVERIAQIKSELKAKGVDLLIVPLPAKNDIYAAKLDGSDIAAAEMAERYSRFLVALTKAGVANVDVRTAFEQQVTSKQLFLRTDTHWTPEGAELTAQTISKAVADLGITGLSTSAVTMSDAGEVKVQGDLTSFVTSGKYAPLVGLETEAVTRVVAQIAGTGTVDLFADDGFEIVLVGTSYSANQNWSFPEYLKQNLKSDVLNVAKEGQGPGIPMLDYLAGEQLRQTPPKLVIWEFPVRYLGQESLWHGKASEPLLGASVTPITVAPASAVPVIGGNDNAG